MASVEDESVLSKAARLVENNIQSDSKFPSLSELLHASSSGEYEQAIPVDWQVLRQQRLIPLPDALFQQYDLLECRCFMGLFPEIKRVWITVDHRLFLWNYEDESDFYSFDDQEQIIVSVALVRPQAGVFVDAIKHVLVVATPLEVFLLGVGYAEGGAGARGGEVTLYATQISVAADGVSMTSIAGTDDGRVFMAGNDGALYEFAYQASDGWMTRRARKVNLTASVAAYFVPTFLGVRRSAACVALAVDNERRLVHVLLQDASVKVFWLGAQGGEFVQAHHHKTIASAAALLCPQFNEGAEAGGAGSSSAAFGIVSLHVIPAAEARTLSLVAVTRGGSRLYFSTAKRMQRLYDGAGMAAAAATMGERPEAFELVHVRLAPETQPTLAGHGGRRTALNVHTALCSSGTVLLAHTWSEDHDAVLGAAPACARVLASAARQPRTTLVEHASTTRVEGRTWAICALGAGAAAAGLNDLATAAGQPTRRFAVLTNAGVALLEQQRPVEMLRQLLARAAPAAEGPLGAFMRQYGADETCAMCFALLCADDAGRAAAGMHVLGGARRVLFEYGGVPRVGDAGGVVLSGRHNGLAAYVARALQPAWALAAVVGRPGERSGSTRLHVGIAAPLLGGVQARLRRLQQFVAANQRFVPDQLNQMPLAASQAGAADAATCWHAEALSLAALYDLVVRAIEVVSFLGLLGDSNLPAVGDALDAAQRQRLAGVTFAQLAAGGDAGQQACRDLIMALVNSQIRQAVGGDSVSDVLAKRCATLLASTDVGLYKAMELLKLALAADEGSERRALAQDALARLLAGSVAGTLTPAVLGELAASFERLGELAAVVALALACAQQSDAHNAAIAYWGAGAPAGDPREPAYVKRMACYACILDMFGRQRARTLTPAALARLPQEDALFHYALYDWLLAQADMAPLLFAIGGAHVEEYLALEPRTLDKSEMLWKYYVHEGRHACAAMVQRQIACGQAGSADNAGASEAVGLAQRIEYLSLAVGNCKVAIDRVRAGQQMQPAEGAAEDSLANELSQVLRATEDQLDVAQVQLEIQQQLVRQPPQQQQQHAELIHALDRQLYSVSELYERFAEPLRLWDCVLLIFKVSSQHVDEGDAVAGGQRNVVEDVWRSVTRQVLDDVRRTGLMAVGERVAQLGARLYPSAAAFPLAAVASILLELAVERPAEYSPGFVSDTLLHASVPYWAVFDTLNALYVRAAASATAAPVGSMRGRGPVGTPGGRAMAAAGTADMLAREIAALASRWVDVARGAAATSMADDLARSQTDAMPVIAVDEALSQYIINATLHNNVQLKTELQRVQDSIRQIL
ncbi:hypothetical protein LPJ53_003074 [Coemansia erecta]|uniref:Nucleoporin-domain-containing protein n=1 Tax=Coemansia erecta TaxID=147472 RepID=A0A9W8CQJ6_9FUNG|nr:hypothetical protein LPJ53_003074 [Coemansia erecta]